MIDDIFVVERIINKRTLENGQVEYFLKWFGYSEDEATWEPEENVFCKDLIQLYENGVNIDELIMEECKLIMFNIINEVENLLETDDASMNELIISSCFSSTNISTAATIDEDEQTDKSFLLDMQHAIENRLCFNNNNNNIENEASQLSNNDNAESKLNLKRTRKQASPTYCSPRKKLRSSSLQNTTTVVDENANDINVRKPIEIQRNSIDYLALKPQRIVSITRSRLPAEELEFLLQCQACPKKLFFISNEKAKELIPDLLIEFYERHINWFITKPSTNQRKSRENSNSTNLRNSSRKRY